MKKTPNFEKIAEVMSDTGGIRITCQDMSFQIKNGYGDGITNVYFTDDDNFHAVFDFIGRFTIKGKAYITTSDCSDEPIYTLPIGRYVAYHNKGNIFLSWKKF